MPSNISSFGALLSTSAIRFSRNCASGPAADTVSSHRTLSLPRKSNLTLPSGNFTCSFRSVVAPTVSASSSPFSSPTLIDVR